MSNKCTTSIHCSMGPACDSAETLAAMMDAGMNVLRINLSHGSAVSQADRYEIYRKACEIYASHDTEIMYDLCGPNVRIGELPGDVITYREGENIIFPEVNYDNFSSDLEVGTEILVDDGLVRFVVSEIEGSEIHCRVTMGGEVASHKGVNVPDIKLGMQFLSKQDREDILWCIEHNVDYIAASFVRRGDDVRDLRDFLIENGGENIKVVAKIENREAIDSFEEIVQLADLILIARGDMGVEIGYEKVPGVQKKIIERCNKLGVPVIVATQMADSMMHRKMPTRAEVSDIYNTILDGADALMVTGETAIGEYPVEVVRELVKVALQAEQDKKC